MDINLNNAKKMLTDVNESVIRNVTGNIETFKRIKWKSVSFMIPITPSPAKRPRLSKCRIYVPGAAKNGTFFNRTVLPTLNGLFITTPCKINLDIYMETPKSFTKTQRILAEMKHIRPWGTMGDIDNFEKAVYDMMQPNEKRGHKGIMSNDCLIIEGHTNKYYSVTPRYELTISYMTNITDDMAKVMRYKYYENTH